jgi:hypothetical protein
MKKILYVILHTCTRPDRHDGIVSSWGQDVDYIFYADCDNKEKNIIKVSNDSTYTSNEPKHVNVLKYLVENNYPYEWFFFCDDDTFVNTKNLKKNLDLFDINKITGSLLEGTWREDPKLNYCSGGAGYLIHNTTLEKIGKTIELENTGYSDVTLGIWALKLGIHFENDDRFKSQSPEVLKIDKSLIKDIFSFHYITSERMCEFYDIVKT